MSVIFVCGTHIPAIKYRFFLFASQIVVGSFLTGSQHEQKIKKQKTDNITTAVPTAAMPISAAAIPISSAGQQHTSATVNHNVTSLSFGGDNWSPYPSESRNNQTDINITLPG